MLHDRWVEEAVHVEALGGLGDVGQGEVESEDDNEPENVDPGCRIRARHEDLEQSESRVEAMLREVAPRPIPGREPSATVRVQDAPVDDGHEEGIGGDRGVVKGVKGLQRAGPFVEKCDVPARVCKGVERSEEEVEGDAPVCQHGEVRKARSRELAGIRRTSGWVCALVADSEEEGGESIYSLCHEHKVSDEFTDREIAQLGARRMDNAGPLKEMTTQKHGTRTTYD